MLSSFISRAKNAVVNSFRSRFSRKHAANSVLQAVALSQGTTVEVVRAQLAAAAAAAAKANTDETACATELRTNTATEQAAVVLSAQELYEQIVAEAQAQLDKVVETSKTAIKAADETAKGHEATAKARASELAQINQALAVV